MNMNNESQNFREEGFGPEAREEKPKNDSLLPVSILISTIILAGSWIYASGLKAQNGGAAKDAAAPEKVAVGDLEGSVLPQEGIVLPIHWENLGARLIEAGVIDSEKLE